VPKINVVGVKNIGFDVLVATFIEEIKTFRPPVVAA